MNPDIKIRYRLKNKSGDLKTVTFTIQEIENGILLRYFGNYWEVIGRDRYTGMEDKNGVEIFQGDIIIHDIDPAMAHLPRKRIVAWNENRASWNITPRNTARLSVIGDMNSNPELLNNL